MATGSHTSASRSSGGLLLIEDNQVCRDEDRDAGWCSSWHYHAGDLSLFCYDMSITNTYGCVG